jgi:hypothetical protein
MGAAAVAAGALRLGAGEGAYRWCVVFMSVMSATASESGAAASEGLRGVPAPDEHDVYLDLGRRRVC